MHGLRSKLDLYRTRAEWAAYGARIRAASSVEERNEIRHAWLGEDLSTEEIAHMRRVRLMLTTAPQTDAAARLAGFYRDLALGMKDVPESQEKCFREADVANALRRFWQRCEDDDFPLDRDHLAELERSTIDRTHALEAGLWSEYEPTVMASMLHRHAPGQYLVYPYFRPGRSTPEYFRAKRMDQKRLKYAQPTGVPTGIYYPPRARRSGELRRVERDLVIVEGEKKALVLDRMGYAVVGLPGVWCAGDTSLPKGEHVLHPWLREDVVLEGRNVVIAFDSNLRTNGDIRAAARRLTAMLARAGVGEIKIVNWPVETPSWVNGVDDLARAMGDDAVKQLVAGATRSLVALGIDVPVALAAKTNISATQKVVYGALAARAGSGTIVRASLYELASILKRSRQAVGATITSLVAAGLVKRWLGRATEKRPEVWVRDTSEYELVTEPTDGETSEIVSVDAADLQYGDHAALVLGLLRARAGEVSVAELRQATGCSERTMRRTLAGLGPLVVRRRGAVRL